MNAPGPALNRTFSKFVMMGLILLVTGVSANIIIPRIYDPQATVPLPLANLLPTEVPGWRVKDLALADTEAINNRVANILQYDDTLFRSFTRGDLNVGVYVSYWLPGKVSYYDAGVHTPDTCWVYSGWQRLSRQHAVPLQIGMNLTTKPAEVGTFIKDSTRLYVAFWHLVGGQVNTYDQIGWRDGAQGHIERFPNYVRDFRRYGFNQQQEQAFVRITSTQPVELVLQNPEIAGFIAGLGALGLFAE